MMRSDRLALMAVLLGLGGCAGLSEQECQVSDWRTIGFEDGAAGRPVGNIGNYRQSCSKYGITPNLDAYRSGHEEGAREFCKPGNGFEAGRNGARYAGVCPADLEPEFLAAYNQGHHLYELESTLRATTQQIAYKKDELEKLKKASISNAAAIVSDDTPAADRAALLTQTADNAKRQGELEKEISSLEATRVLQEQELLSYRATVADRL
ncbi:MAG TPA: DUF2799 domain-containing protein [Gammaproteobacteria bacterium]|nr:DUF2799 domain-containing protein [Gammaproteobacteria bacterium]